MTSPIEPGLVVKICRVHDQCIFSHLPIESPIQSRSQILVMSSPIRIESGARR